MLFRSALLAGLAVCAVQGQLLMGSCRGDADCRLLGDRNAQCREASGGKRCTCSDQLPPVQLPPADAPADAPEDASPEETKTFGRVSDDIPVCVEKVGGVPAMLNLGVRLWYPAGKCAKFTASVRQEYVALLKTVVGEVQGELSVACGLHDASSPAEEAPEDDRVSTSARSGNVLAAGETEVGVAVMATVATDAARVTVFLTPGSLAAAMNANPPAAVQEALGAAAEAALVYGFECTPEGAGVEGGAVEVGGRCQPLQCAAGYVLHKTEGQRMVCKAVPQPKAADDDDGLSDGEVVGIVLGCVGGLLVVIVVVWVMMRKNETLEQDKTEPTLSA